jgi:hypothetical protein
MSGILSNNMSNQMPPGMSGMNGPSGKWINPRSGKSVIVKDTFIDGEHMNVMLSDGSIIPMNDFSRNYIQMSEEEYDSTGVQVSANSSNNDLTSQIDESLLFKGMGQAPAEQIKVSKPNVLDPSFVENYSEEYETNNSSQTTTGNLVEKIFDKNDGPKLKINIEWPDFPKKELQMLKNYFDVTDDEIVNSVINKYVNTDFIKEALESAVCTLLENNQ